jgi:alpha-L-fucosidase 2
MTFTGVVTNVNHFQEGLMKKAVLLMIVVSLVNQASDQAIAATIKVACVGNSITAGFGVTTSYPTRLQGLLGAGYAVTNEGNSGKTLLKSGDDPYWNCEQFFNVFVIKPDIITIKLGTNDSKPQNWQYKSRFAADLNALIDTFQTISPRPQIFIVLPVPAFKPSCCGINGDTIHLGIEPILKSVAAVRGLPVIDCYTPLINHPEIFVVDGVHPNDNGADTIAHVIPSSDSQTDHGALEFPGYRVSIDKGSSGGGTCKRRCADHGIRQPHGVENYIAYRLSTRCFHYFHERQGRGGRNIGSPHVVQFKKRIDASAARDSVA